jgi:hypothetical protein
MSATLHQERAAGGPIALRGAIVVLTLSTAAIHASLGGTLFLLNAAGYAALALGMVLPGLFHDLRWLVRLGLASFTATTIMAWLLMGARFPLAYLDKGLEVVLIALVVAEMVRARRR